MHPPSCPAPTHLHEDHVLLTQREHQRSHASTHRSLTCFCAHAYASVCHLAITTEVLAFANLLLFMQPADTKLF